MTRAGWRLHVKSPRRLSRAKKAGQFAAYSMLGHKGDLMLVHFRDSFDDLNQAELTLDRTGLRSFWSRCIRTCQ